MTRKTSIGTLKSVWEGEEEQTELEETPVDRDVMGRPDWWFNGSLFIPNTYKERRLAKLQCQALARANPVLSVRAHRIRRYIGILCQWFPLPLLDEIGKDLLIDTNFRHNDENLLAHFLGALEFALRQRDCTLRWAILQEINQTTGQYLEKKEIYKWLFYTRQRKREQVPDTLRIIQHLTIEALSQEIGSPDHKRALCSKVVKAITALRVKGFVCKDPEVVSWALKRIILEDKGPQTNIPKELRSKTARMTFRIRRLLE
ncbi:MAG: hypothetical protein ACFFBD_16940 [Candidatus Hodarchaeota archaeon]